MATPPLSLAQRSLPIRVTILMAMAVAVMMMVLSTFVATHVRDGMFEERLRLILSDANLRATTVQAKFDQAQVESLDQVQDLAYQVMSEQREAATGAGGIGVLLLRDPATSASGAINAVVDEELSDVVTPAMRAAVADSRGQHWQSATVPVRGREEPGIVVGSRVNLPMAGNYDMYLVYSLATEQRTIDMINQVLVVGTGVMLAILGVLMLVVSYQSLLPVRRAANAALRVSDGDFSVRLPVEGRDELATLSRAFNEMTAELQRQITDYQQLAALQQRFVSDVSHELRTPLASIQIGAEILHEHVDDLPEHMRRPTKVMYQQVERFNVLLADLLEISRVDAHTARVDRQQRDVAELIDHVCDANSEVVQRLGVEVRRHVAVADTHAEIDHVRVERIVRNLLLNAVEFAEGGPVDITLAGTDTAIAIIVRDYGVGMTDEVATHVFDRFYRADTSRVRSTGGTGLGLAISAEDAHLHDGLLTVLACPGEGSAFVLVLPRHADHPIEDLPQEVYDERLIRARVEWARLHPDEVDVTVGVDADPEVKRLGALVRREGASTREELRAGPGAAPALQRPASAAEGAVEDPATEAKNAGADAARGAAR